MHPHILHGHFLIPSHSPPKVTTILSSLTFSKTKSMTEEIKKISAGN
jgi:hypothetical protein